MIMNMFCQSKLERSHCSALIPDQWHCHTSQTCISLSGHVLMYHDWFQRDTHHAQSHTGSCSSSQTKIWLHFRKRTFCYHIHSTKNRQVEQNNHTSHNAYSTRHLITLHFFLGSNKHDIANHLKQTSSSYRNSTWFLHLWPLSWLFLYTSWTWRTLTPYFQARNFSGHG